MSGRINQDVVWLDITGLCQLEGQSTELVSLPMNEAQVVDRLDGENAFRHVKLGDVLGEGIVLDQPVLSALVPVLGKAQLTLS